MTTTVQPDQSPKSMHPNRTDYPPVEPVICSKGPLLYPNIEWRTERAGHAYRKVDGVWTCRNCQEPRP